MPRMPVSSAEVLAWPIGFGDVLPTDRWQGVHGLSPQEKRLIADFGRLGIAGLVFIEDRIRRCGKGALGHSRCR